MRYVDELKAALTELFPDFGKSVVDLPEGEFIGRVAVAFKTRTDPNPTDFCMKILGLIQNGSHPNNGDRQGRPEEKAENPRGTVA
ncbi:hypothetical protein UFOVP1672_19 [uncultured Caudovirales phage]|uniref:Uncharacterized protein n=1 Tax=uncultured Caudovirales phage TaxID=2100421 RepID=A0A6J5QA84_9CAUD|nr:hypothetical protein UFOVP988_41 [uncultured Caudovirales phage]CAB4210788.1 hypothetical protein UFOVP1425_41 [uncultured Caudovirales phage]CAB4223324.1 hypothetical protein UFOVP1672_19 [uncultured Caudovirales phage]